MTDLLVGGWYAVFASVTWIAPLCLMVWAIWLYVLFLSQGPRRGTLLLSRSERRRLGPEPRAERSSHRAWTRLRAKHLRTARAVERSHAALFIAPLWFGTFCGLSCLALAGFFAWSSIVDESARGAGGLSMALGFVAAVPSLATVLLRRRMWMWRARTEWQVVLLCDRLVSDAEAEIDQDFVARRTGRVLSALARRLPAGHGSVTLEERRRWASALRPTVAMRAELVTADRTETRRWDGWVASWTDLVAQSFDPSIVGRRFPEDQPIDGIERRDVDSQGFTWLIVICCLFATFGLVLTAFADGTLDLASVWTWWDSAAGRSTTAISGIGGVLGILAFFRHRSRAAS
ncbi:hypothetical protein P9139_11860 [Curtobacterium flaccumfaciens]|nr:hypothetical protein P9139_11860 [Curtobacterium flaccumfaciens]